MAPESPKPRVEAPGRMLVMLHVLGLGTFLEMIPRGQRTVENGEAQRFTRHQ